MTDNGPAARPWLRALLLLFSLVGTIAAAQLSGTPSGPNVVSADVLAIVQTGVVAYLAHAFYTSAFRR